MGEGSHAAPPERSLSWAALTCLAQHLASRLRLQLAAPAASAAPLLGRTAEEPAPLGVGALAACPAIVLGAVLAWLDDAALAAAVRQTIPAFASQTFTFSRKRALQSLREGPYT